MRGPKPSKVQLTPVLKSVLEIISRCYTNPYWLVVRAKIIGYAADGLSNDAIGQRLDSTADTVRT